MPSRRAVLAGVGSTLAVGLAGCNGTESREPPAGSLRVRNDDTALPHDVRMVVTAVGTEPGDEAGTVTGDPDGIPGDVSRSMTVGLDSDTTRTYESAFRFPVWYAVEFTVDGQVPETRDGRVAFNPAPENEERGRILEATIDDGGSFGFSVAATDDPGEFDI